ncbi:hypothetical protein Tco_0221439 [Tanacetum coccineum]
MVDRRAIPDAMAQRHYESDVYDAFSNNDFSIQDVKTLNERIIDLRLVPPGLFFSVGLATTWDFPGFFPVFKDTGGNVVTMSEYLYSPFLSGASIVQGNAIPPNHLVGQNTTSFLSADQSIPNKTDSQLEVEVEDLKVIAAREKKKTQAARTVVHFRNTDGGPNAPDDENRSVSHSPRGSVIGAPASQPRDIVIGETLKWANPPGLLLYMLPTRASLIGVAAWFSLARGAMAQTDILKRFENLQDDYNRLADTHAECPDTVWKLVTARQDLKHNARLYTDVINRYKELKEEHARCEQIVKLLEDERNNLSVVNKDQALKIQELKAEVARKDFALAVAERVSADGAMDHQKFVTQLSQEEVKKFNCRMRQGVGRGRSEKEILAALHRAENFDAYYDRKLYPMYDKLFEKEYPYIMKFASGYRHFVTDLLKIHPDPAPSGGTLALTISKPLEVFNFSPFGAMHFDCTLLAYRL